MPNRAIDRTFASELRSPASAGHYASIKRPLPAQIPRLLLENADGRYWSRTG